MEQPEDSGAALPTFAQRLQWRRRVARELDKLLGTDRRPDVNKVYVVPATREGEPE